MKLNKILVNELRPCGVFTGNIRKCTKFNTSKELSEIIHSTDDLGDVVSSDKIYKKNATLVKFKNGAYVDIDDIDDLLDILTIMLCTDKNGFYLNSILMDTKANKEGCLFVDESSLKPYKKKKNLYQVNVSVKVLKKSK